MRRSRKRSAAGAGTQVAEPPGTAALTAARQEPHLIHETAVYSIQQAQQALGLKRSTIRREHREGRLRVAKRAGRCFLLGRWLLEWLQGGEVRRERSVSAIDGHHHGLVNGNGHTNGDR